jgi:hypothetical protein
VAKPYERPSTEQIADRIATVKALIIAGSDVETVIDWCQRKYAATPQQPAKEWVVSRQTARTYVNKAFEAISGEDVAPKDRKRARNRAMITLIIQRLMANGSPTALIGALKGMDQLCKIDASYDPAQLGAAGSSTMTPEDAAARIEHAHATLQLARSRGVIAAPASGRPVIDVGDEPEDVPDPDDPELDDEQPEDPRPTNAN